MERKCLHVVLLVGVILPLALSGCAPGATPTPRPAPTLSPAEATAQLPDWLAGADNGFAFRLFARALQEAQGDNVFLSPPSVALALAMTYNGAGGETQAAMARALGLDGRSLDEVNRAYQALRDALANPEPKVQLNIANSLWARQGVAFKPDFLERNRSYYAAEVNTLQFDAAAPGKINGWVKDKTQGKIDKIVDDVDPATIMYLINAIYFKGQWTDPFDDKATRPADFTLGNGKKVQLPRMIQGGHFAYLEEPGFQAIRLPYGDERFGMYIFLPAKSSSLEAFLADVDCAQWAKWLDAMEPEQGSIALPRFKVEYETSLKAALTALGMGVAFDKDRADFEPMVTLDGRAWIDEVKHKTYLSVNEAGTEAAAVTSVAVVGSAAPARPFTMVVDRPFFCAIVDGQTGMVLFMGAVTQPK